MPVVVLVRLCACSEVLASMANANVLLVIKENIAQNVSKRINLDDNDNKF